MCITYTVRMCIICIIYIYIYIYIYTVKPLYKKLFFFSTFFLIERFSYIEVFTFPMILRINL